jgi:signal peptidase I
MIPTMEIGDHIFVNKFKYGLRIPLVGWKFFEFRKPEPGEVIVFINPCEPDKDFIKRVVAVEGDTVEVRCDVLYVNGAAVPAELDEARCSFWGKEEDAEGGQWHEGMCSRYVERHAGVTYKTLHSSDRPSDDRERATLPDAQLPGERDFPDREPPDCGSPDPRDPAQRAASRGTIEPSVPEGQGDDVGGACTPQRRYRVPAGHVFVMGDNRDNSSDSRAWGAVPLENIKGEAMFIWWSRRPPSAGGVQLSRIGQIVE